MKSFFGGSNNGGGKKNENASMAVAYGVDPSLFEDPKFDEEEDIDLPNGMEVDVQSLMNEGDADNIEVTEDDMNDPALLAELQEMSEPGSEGIENKIQVLRDQIAQERKKALEFGRKKEMPQARQALSNAKNLQTQLDALTGHTGGGGDATAHATAPAHAKPAPAPAPVKVASAPTPAPAAKPAPVIAQPARPAPAKVDEMVDELSGEEDETADNKEAAEIRNRILNYKKAALAAKTAGNRAAALQYVHSIKQFDKALEDADMGFPVDMKSLPPATPPPLSASDGPSPAGPYAPPHGGGSPITVMTAAQKEAQKRQQTLETLMGELAKTVEIHKATALSANHAGDKTGAGAALNQMKEAKNQYAILQAALTDPSIPLPEHHFETKETRHEVAFANLAPHDFELTFLHIKDLRPLSGYPTLSLYVYTEIQISQEPPQKIQTPVVNNSLAPAFNFTTKLLIDRTNKAFHRFVEKRKITFIIYHYRFLIGPILIGKAEMKLSDLLEKAEIQEELPIIKEGTKRPIGGTLGIRLRLKTPLVKKDVRVTKETILVIDGAFPSIVPSTTTTTTTTTPSPNKHPTPAAASKSPPAASLTQKPAAATTTPTKPQLAPTPTAAPTPSPPQKSAAPPAAVQKPAAAPVQKPAAAAQPAATHAGEEELDLDDVNSIDNMISNDVLENEAAAVDAQIAAYAQKKQAPPEALVDRKQALELKMNILVIQVQSGQITPEKYVEMLKAKVDAETALAKKLVASGKKEWARFPLQRIKIMKAEIESASEEDEG